MQGHSLHGFIREERNRQGISQQKLADEANLALNTVANIEQQRTGLDQTKISTLRDLVEAMGFSLEIRVRTNSKRVVLLEP